MKVCPPKLPTPLVPSPINPINFKPSVPSASIPKLPGTGPTNRNTCGGKNKKLCEGVPIMLCRNNPCCFVDQNQLCASVSEVKYKFNGQECTDLVSQVQCEMSGLCMWNAMELECDELNEMECQDLRKADCDAAQTCHWVPTPPMPAMPVAPGVPRPLGTCMEIAEAPMPGFGMMPGMMPGMPGVMGMGGKLQKTAPESSESEPTSKHTNLLIDWRVYLAVLAFGAGSLLIGVYLKENCQKRNSEPISLHESMVDQF